MEPKEALIKYIGSLLNDLSDTLSGLSPHNAVQRVYLLFYIMIIVVIVKGFYLLKEEYTIQKDKKD